mmetsp:Transcript_84563/g.217868  ORF Transcript_84563/g.217868 Transcript_84563/m.217868 type:complete len:209 (-) Transcript_84563:152-778(-)
MVGCPQDPWAPGAGAAQLLPELLHVLLQLADDVRRGPLRLRDARALLGERLVVPLRDPDGRTKLLTLGLVGPGAVGAHQLLGSGDELRIGRLHRRLPAVARELLGYRRAHLRQLPQVERVERTIHGLLDLLGRHGASGRLRVLHHGRGLGAEAPDDLARLHLLLHGLDLLKSLSQRPEERVQGRRVLGVELQGHSLQLHEPRVRGHRA